MTINRVGNGAFYELFGCRKLNEEGKLLNEANYFYILGLYRELVREMERDSKKKKGSGECTES
jgi:hypothetical protein